MARIVSVAEVGDPERLVTLAEAIFGAGDRPHGWFARKLARERVDASCSVLAIDDDAAPDDPQGWLGYVLVGLPTSLGDVARTSGTGVLERARGRGLATRLLDAAAASTRAAGRRALQLLADPTLVDFYGARGFALQRRLVTLVRPSRGPAGLGWSAATAAAAPMPSPAADLASAQADGAWLPDAWSHTDPALRHVVHGPEGTAWVSREGRGIVVHHLQPAPDCEWVETAHALLRRLPAGHPVLLPLRHEVSTVTERLVDAGWHAVQRSALLQRAVVDQSPG